jgi:Flp pilus assembly protein CpaB
VRASTFFAIFVALILGFAGLGAAKYFGFFRAPAPVVERKAEPLPKVLIARKNLPQNYVVNPGDVTVRELTREEFKDYENHQNKYLPAMPEAVTLRVLNREVNAGQILLFDYLEPLVIPLTPSEVMRPGMKAVRVNLTRDYAQGGLIRVGDNVDVNLMCRITGNGNEQTKIAPIALGLPVIFKRDTLFPVLAPLPEDKPMQFTLEADPYRAALIEFAASRGQLSLVPTASQPRPKDGPKTFNIPSSKEYRNEDERVAAFLSGDRSVGDADLERIFNLPPLPIRENIQIVTMSGSKIRDSSKGSGQFTRTAEGAPAADPDQPGYGYHFSYPSTPATEQAAAPSGAARGVPMVQPRQGAGAAKK